MSDAVSNAPLAQPQGRWFARIISDWSSSQRKLYVYLESPLEPMRRRWLTLAMYIDRPRGETSEQVPSPLLWDDKAMANDQMSPLQALMDALWEEGLRPKGHVAPEPTEGHLTALHAHLDDMRKLVFR